MTGSEYYVYHTVLQLSSLEVEKFEINQRNEFEIVIKNIVFKKLILELEIYQYWIQKFIGRFAKIVFEEKNSSNKGLTIE